MPGCWEILTQRRNRVLVVTITPPDLKVTMAWAMCMRELELPPGSDFVRIAGYPFGPARNQGLVSTINGGYGWMLTLDSDTLVPKDGLMKLLATGRDYIGALYHQRFPPYKPAAFMKQIRTVNQNGQMVQVMEKVDLPAFQYGDIIPVDFLPTGATLISRRCLETVLSRYPKPFEWTVDIDNPAGVCALPGEEVFWGSPIEQVQEGEFVLDATGMQSKVVRKFRRHYEGDIVTITPSTLHLPIRVTGDHHILVGHRRKSSGVRIPPRDLHEQWLPARQVTPEMFVAFPIPKIPFGNWKRLYVPKHLRGGWQKNNRDHALPKRISRTPALFEWCGLYLAEGSASEGGRVLLSFGPHEQKLVDKAMALQEQIFPTLRKPKVVHGDHELQVSIQHRGFSALLRQWFGDGAKKKHVPRWILEERRSAFVNAFLRGVFLGDGYWEKTHQSIGLNLVSKKAILDIAALLIRHKIRVSVIPHKAHATAFNSGTMMYRLMVHQDAAKLAHLLDLPWTPKPHPRNNRSFFKNGKLWMAVHDMTSQQYSGEVFDLMVEPNNSYVLGMTICHNSEDFAFSLRAQALGFQPFLATNVQAKHEMLMAVGVRGPEMNLF